MPVPASYNDVFADAGIRDYVGEVWYQTTVRVPERWAGERIVLRFDAATHRGTAWVNGTQVVEHAGGYTPFEADVSEVVELGAENRITVAVDNRLSWQTSRPGAWRRRRTGCASRYFHDFFNYAGLHRSVWLYRTPRSYIEDITVVTGLERATGTVTYEVEAAGHDAARDPSRAEGRRGS